MHKHHFCLMMAMMIIGGVLMLSGCESMVQMPYPGLLLYSC